MVAEIGKGYTEVNPARFGTSAFDCSGLMWYAANQAGIAMPGGPSNVVAALAPYELLWAIAQVGSVSVFNEAEIQQGDWLGFVGADPAPFDITISGHTFVGSGHIGMAVSATEYVSAYDTADGVCIKPISGDAFQVAIRMAE
jgi:cell wall-associated NlpC family hydrolase